MNNKQYIVIESDERTLNHLQRSLEFDYIDLKWYRIRHGEALDRVEKVTEDLKQIQMYEKRMKMHEKIPEGEFARARITYTELHDGKVVEAVLDTYFTRHEGWLETPSGIGIDLWSIIDIVVVDS